MSDAVSGLADIPAFQNLFLMFQNPILGVLVGAVLTGVIQSSSASVGILQALSATGAVTYAAAVPIIMGQNIGTCVTALLSSLGTNKNARRAAVIHLSFNVIGTIVWLSLFSLASAIFKPALLEMSANHLGIAVAHSIFNILCTVLLLPLSSLLEKLAYLVVPEGNESEQTVELDDRLLVTPTIALQQSNQLAVKMAKQTVEGFRLSLECLAQYDEKKALQIRKLEDNTDHYEDVLGTFLTKAARAHISEDDSSEVSKLLKVIGDLERISDHSVNVLESAEELREKKIELSAEAKKELGVLCAALLEILTLTQESFANNDLTLAQSIEPLEQVIDNLRTALRDNHVLRLRDGDCTVEAGFIWADLLTNLERASDHCSNIAICILDAGKHTMNAHEAARLLKEGNPAFAEKFYNYSRKYNLNS